jgi:hypothetical protein
MSKQEDGYNGWSNYETWLVNLWWENDPETYDFAQTLTEGAKDVWELANEIKEATEEGQVPNLGSTLAADLLNAALSEVDWDEIARAWWEGWRS